VTANRRGTRTPVSIITGFLGAGKTSLINSLLNGDHGLRLAVLVNEFGELGIDGALIASAATSMIEVPNGCICCTGRGDLGRALAALLDLRDDLDGVLIEASGLAEPLGVVDTVTAPRFCERVRLDAVITVVDAANFDANLDNAVVAYQQLIAADLFLVNKIDLVGEEITAAIETNLARLNPSAAVVRRANGDVPPWTLLQRDPGEAGWSRTTPTCRHDADINSVSCELDGPVDRKQFDAWAAALPSNAWRVKALLRFERTGPWLSYQRVGARESVELLAGTVPIPAAGRVVVIGRDLDGASIADGLRRCHSKEVLAHARVA
jgi:G3E family GTPase